jgi:bacterial leucyl aminopeptidase
VALALDLEGIGGDDFSVRLHRFTEITTKGSYALDNVEAELVGSELQEMVLITAHLDSTAAFTKFEDREYIPDEDPAAGADDDGSGMAAVLAAARAIKKLSAVKRPKRTIRFVLFNAEEEGLVGSGEYARDQRALRAPIVAVYQMDMMGYNREAPRTYEIHAGADSKDVQDRSLVLAERIGNLSEEVSPNLPAPQIYLNQGLAQQDKDPAYNRSDHHSFHLVRYAACAATEDFFAGPRPDSPRGEGNPNYHQTSDTFVDPEYTADIARAVAAAAWATVNL